jgi:2'-5' RNA ligase
MNATPVPPARTLYTLAYPRWSEIDSQFIEQFRAANDLRSCDVVAAHFTLVFPCGAVGEPQYTEHVQAVAREQPAIPFVCRYTMLGTDAQDSTAYVFLVPDEGFSDLSLLHDRLYRGVLEPHLRLDIPYIPHITIGTVAERKQAKRLCDQLNERGIYIAGRVERLSVCTLEGGKVRTIESFPLQT